jgi:DNA-binding response OmpR family regulator
MSKKILVVDDDEINLKMIESRLSKAGYDVVLARDGDIALQEVRKERPDLIILDVQMPRMSGYTFMFEVNKIPGYKPVPIIVVTAHEENQPIFEHRGARGYLVKPVNFDELFNRIRICLGEKGNAEEAVEEQEKT